MHPESFRTFRFFYGWGLLDPHTNLKLQEKLLWAPLRTMYAFSSIRNLMKLYILIAEQ
jgi:hypothetical protein